MPKKKNPNPSTLADNIGAATDAMTEVRSRTYPGQAHFAGPLGGPTCRQCQNWDYGSNRNKGIYYAATGMLKGARCLKTQQLMMCQNTARVPHFAPACRFYVDNPDAPPAFKHEPV
jgi:hypothetical protein